MCCLRSTTVKFCGEERFPTSADEFMDWFYSVSWDRRRGGKWEASRDEYRLMGTLKDGTGLYFLTPAMSENAQYRAYFLGCPVMVDGDVIEDNGVTGHCPYCKVKITGNGRFCDRCGAPL